MPIVVAFFLFISFKQTWSFRVGCCNCLIHSFHLCGRRLMCVCVWTESEREKKRDRQTERATYSTVYLLSVVMLMLGCSGGGFVFCQECPILFSLLFCSVLFSFSLKAVVFLVACSIVPLHRGKRVNTR